MKYFVYLYYEQIIIGESDVQCHQACPISRFHILQHTAVEMLRYTNTTNNEKVAYCFFLDYVRI